MDLTLLQISKPDLLETKNQLNNEVGNHVYKSVETVKETESNESNKFSNSFKTETNINCSQYGSLYQDRTCEKEAIFCLYKRAIDLTIHNRTPDGEERTIFDDAEYFSKHYSYKLLPINFQNVDETIINTEHNYCHVALSSGSEAEEDCSRMITYNEIKEKNYKKRKAKFKGENKTHQVRQEGDSVNEQTTVKSELDRVETLMQLSEDVNRKEEPEQEQEEVEEQDSPSVEAIDLSAPLVQENKKTDDSHLGPHSTHIVNDVENENENDKKVSVQLDSDKGKDKSKLNLIEVTITRPDEKENYQPCDLFLNDIARLVPNLIGKNCYEIDIQDRTYDHYVDIKKHRLYYIISESNWRLFERANERVILTNDTSLCEPVERQEAKGQKPTFLVFDQFSLKKCLADYCKEKGGFFEYTCLEETRQEGVEKSDVAPEKQDESSKCNRNDEEENRERKAEKADLVEDSGHVNENQHNEDKESVQNTVNETKVLVADSSLTSIVKDEKLEDGDVQGTTGVQEHIIKDEAKKEPALEPQENTRTDSEPSKCEKSKSDSAKGKHLRIDVPSEGNRVRSKVGGETCKTSPRKVGKEGAVGCETTQKANKIVKKVAKPDETKESDKDKLNLKRKSSGERDNRGIQKERTTDGGQEATGSSCKKRKLTNLVSNSKSVSKNGEDSRFSIRTRSKSTPEPEVAKANNPKQVTSQNGFKSKLVSKLGVKSKNSTSENLARVNHQKKSVEKVKGAEGAMGTVSTVQTRRRTRSENDKGQVTNARTEVTPSKRVRVDVGKSAKSSVQERNCVKIVKRENGKRVGADKDGGHGLDGSAKKAKTKDGEATCVTGRNLRQRDSTGSGSKQERVTTPSKKRKSKENLSKKRLR